MKMNERSIDMKVIIRAPMKGDEIAALLDGYSESGTTFTFEKRDGISLTFNVEGGGAADVCAMAKAAIKATPWGKILYYSIDAK